MANNKRVTQKKMKCFRQANAGDWRGIVAIIMMWSFFLSDSMNVFLKNSGLFDEDLVQYFQFSTFTRGGAFLFLSTWFLFKKNGTRQCLVGGLILTPVIWLGLEQTDLLDAMIWMHQLSRYAFPLLLFAFFQSASPRNKELIEKMFLGIIVLQIIVVLVAFGFQIDLFWSYSKHRFGYSGLIIAVNEATFFYVIAGIFLLAKYNSEKKIAYLVVLLFLLLTMLLLGAKAVLIFAFSLGLFTFLHIPYKTLSKRQWGLGGSVIMIGIILFFIYHDKTGFADFHVNTIKENGWTYYLSSGRNLLITQHAWPLIKSWQWYNFLFGGANPVVHSAQMDVLDLFLFSGIVGSLYYYYLLFSGLFRFKNNNKTGWLLVIQFFVIGGLAGHVFASGINAFYLVILCHYLQKRPDA